MKKITIYFFISLFTSLTFAQKPKFNSNRIITNQTVNFPPEDFSVVPNTYATNRSASLNETFEVAVPPIGWLANDFIISNATQESKATGNAGHFAYFEASNIKAGNEGTLTTPVLQPLAGNNTLSFKVNYYVINAAWKDAGAKLFVEFSEDAGASWTNSTDNVLASLANYNTSSTGWLIKNIDLSAYNGKNTTVRFRCVSDYGQANIGIDDVAGPAISLPKNDVSAKKFSLSMNGAGYCQYTPTSQLDSVYFSAQVINGGTDAQTNVTLKANINNDIDFVSGFKNPTASLAPGKIDTIWVATKPKKINDTTEVNYATKIWVTQDQNDEIPLNNFVDSAFFSATANTYLRSMNYNGIYHSYIFQTQAPAKTGFEFGTKYLITKDTKIDNIFGFIPKSIGKGNIVAKLYTLSLDANNKMVYTLVGSSDTLKPSEGSNSNFTNLALKAPYQCKANTTLAAMLQLNGDMGTTNKDSIFIGVDANFPSNPLTASIAYLNVNGTMGWYSLQAVPIVGIDIEKIKLTTCNYTVSQSNFNCSNSNANNYNNIGSVTTSAECSWTALVTSGGDWLSTNSTGNGNGSISITVKENFTASERIGTISINGQTITIKQPANDSKPQPALISVSPDNALAGETLDIIFTGLNTHFSQASKTAVYFPFQQASLTIVNSYAVLSNTQIKANLTIPPTTAPGDYTANVYNEIDGDLTLVNGFKINCSYSLSLAYYYCANNLASTYNNIASILSPSGCSWTAAVVSGSDWLSTTSSGNGNGNISINVTENTGSSERIGTISINGQLLTIKQPVANCNYTISQTYYLCSNNLSNTFNNISSIITSASCSWSANVESGKDWLSTASTGTSNGNISITVTENTNTNERVGTININGQLLVVKQPGADCKYTLSSVNYYCSSNKSSNYNNIVTVNAPEGCPDWSAIVKSGNDWLSTNSSGNGNGNISIIVTENTSSNERIGTIEVKGEILTIKQPAANCNYIISQSIYSCVNSSANSYNSVSEVTTNSGCSWSASVTSGSDWLSTSSSGIGNGSISILVTANTNSNERVGTIDINGQSLTIKQPGKICNYVISQSNYLCNNNTGKTYDNVASLTTDAGCLWTAAVTSGSDWLSTASSGNGNGNISITVTENIVAGERTGTIYINGQTLTIKQPGAVCNYALSQALYFCPSNIANAYNNIVSVASPAGCPNWTALVKTGNDWLSTNSSGNGNGNISITVSANNTANERVATIDIKGQILTIKQPSANCKYLVSIANYSCANSLANTYANIASVSVSNGCSWSAMVVSGNEWLSTASIGNGNGNISITVAENTSSAERMGTLNINGQIITIKQPGASCDYKLSQEYFYCTNSKFNVYNNIVNVTSPTGCAGWTAVVKSGNDWLSTTSSGNGAGIISITVQENVSTNERSGTIDVNGKTLTIKQPGANCQYMISQSNYSCANTTANGYNSIASVTASLGCTWTAVVVSGNEWLSSSSSGNGNGSISITVSENKTSSERIGTININGQILTVKQPGISCNYALSTANYTCSDGKAKVYTFIAIVNTQVGCSWSASVTTGNDWLLCNSKADGSGVIDITVLENNSGKSRIGIINIAGQLVAITQPELISGITKNETGKWSIYPNPASSFIKIENEGVKMDNFSVKIQNILGQTVFTKLIDQQITYIDISNWKDKGVYFIQLIDNKNNISETKKIIIK